MWRLKSIYKNWSSPVFQCLGGRLSTNWHLAASLSHKKLHKLFIDLHLYSINIIVEREGKYNTLILENGSKVGLWSDKFNYSFPELLTEIPFLYFFNVVLFFLLIQYLFVLKSFVFCSLISKKEKKFSYASLIGVVAVVGWTKLLPTPLPISL